MITTPWSLKHTYRTHYQLSSKPVKRLQTLVSLQLWLTVNYSYFFLFLKKTKKRLKLIEHSTLASQKNVTSPSWHLVSCVVWVWQRRWKPLQCSVRNATLVTQGSEAVLSFSHLYVCIHSDVLLYKHFGQGIGSGTSYVCLRWVEGNVVYGLVWLFPVCSNLLYACLAVHVPQADGTIMTCVRQRRDIKFIFKGTIQQEIKNIFRYRYDFRHRERTLTSWHQVDAIWIYSQTSNSIQVSHHCMDGFTYKERWMEGD